MKSIFKLFKLNFLHKGICVPSILSDIACSPVIVYLYRDEYKRCFEAEASISP